MSLQTVQDETGSVSREPSETAERDVPSQLIAPPECNPKPEPRLDPGKLSPASLSTKSSVGVGSIIERQDIEMTAIPYTNGELKGGKNGHNPVVNSSAKKDRAMFQNAQSLPHVAKMMPQGSPERGVNVVEHMGSTTRNISECETAKVERGSGVCPEKQKLRDGDANGSNGDFVAEGIPFHEDSNDITEELPYNHSETDNSFLNATARIGRHPGNVKQGGPDPRLAYHNVTVSHRNTNSEAAVNCSISRKGSFSRPLAATELCGASEFGDKAFTSHGCSAGSSQSMEPNSALVKKIASAATANARALDTAGNLETVNGATSMQNATNGADHNMLSGQNSITLNHGSASIDADNSSYGRTESGAVSIEIKRAELDDLIRHHIWPGRRFGAKKKLWVWSWFVQDPADTTVAVCDYCGKIIRRQPSDKGSPKKLIEHLTTHKLNKTLVNNKRPMSDMRSLSLIALSVLDPYSDNGLIDRKSGMSLMDSAAQQITLLAQSLNLHRSQQRALKFLGNGLSMSLGYLHSLDHDDQRSQHDYNQSSAHTFATIPLKDHQNHQAYLLMQNGRTQSNPLTPFNQPSHINNTVHHNSAKASNTHGYQLQQDGQTYAKRQDLFPNQKNIHAYQNGQLHRHTQNGHEKYDGRETQHRIPLQKDLDMRPETSDTFSSDIRPQPKARHSISFDSEQSNQSYFDRLNGALRRSVDSEVRFDRSSGAFDDSPYTDTNLLRRLLAFLHENKLPIDVIKLESFHQLVFDLRPEAVKDLLVLDTVFSSCVEVSRASSRPLVGTEPVYHTVD